MRRSLLAALAALAAAPATAAAAPGDLDLGFADPDGYVVPDGGGRVTDLLTAPDGSVYATIEQPDSGPCLRVARFTPDGRIDGNFGSNSYPDGATTINVVPGDAMESADAIVRQPDGKIVVGGNAGLRFVVARFHANGTPDDSFNDNDPATPAGVVVTDLPSGGGGETVTALALEPNGDIVAAGLMQHSSSGSRAALVRYRPSGARDVQGFNDSDPASPLGTSVHDLPGDVGHVNDLVRDPVDGSFVIAGSGYDGEGTGTSMLAARIDAGGTLRQSFGGGDGVFTYRASSGDRYDDATAVLRRDDGRLVLAGVAGRGPQSGDTLLARLTPDGVLDPAFGEGGVRHVSLGARDGAVDAAALPDGRIVVAGTEGPDGIRPNVLLARFTAGGSLDAGFGGDGAVTRSITPGADTAHALTLQPGGRVVVGGFSEFRSGVVLPFAAGVEGGDPLRPADPAPPIAAPAPLPAPQPARPAGDPAPPSAPPRSAPDVAPTLSRVEVVRRGTGVTLRLHLSEAATVRIVVTRRGRTRFVRVGSLTRSLAPGAGTIRLTAPLARIVRRPGRFRFSITAADAAGHLAIPVRATLRTR